MGSSKVAVLSLSALVVQNTALVFAMKYSSRASAEKYSTAAVVLSCEILKFIASSVAVFVLEGWNEYVRHVKLLHTRIVLLIPSILYVLQTNLLFVAAESLSPTVYIVCSQAKIISTVAFSRVLLGTKVTLKHAFAIAQLVSGVCLVQENLRMEKMKKTSPDSAVYGLVSILLASCTSGFAGVFLEKNFKSAGASIWHTNVHLSALSLPVSALLTAMDVMNDDAYVFAGFDAIVKTIILLQTLGGLLTAAIMKHASAVLKCYAVSMSICLCAVISVSLGDEVFGVRRAVGILLVNVSMSSFHRARSH